MCILLLFVLMLLHAASSLICHSTVCRHPDEHGFCQETCRGPDEACTGFFFVTPNHTVLPGTFRCHKVAPDHCLSTSCQFNTSTSYFGQCCCRRDLCNIIPGLFGALTPAPPSILPTPPITLPPSVPGDQLICEFDNCSTTSNTNCYHGYQVCSHHPEAELTQPENHFCALHAARTPSGLYQLQSKGCLVTANATIHELGTRRQSCVLDTESSSPVISCYCNQLLCNNATNVMFTDPSRFIGTDPDAPCRRVGCSHSCVIDGGEPHCLCPAGFALDTDRLTCNGELVILS